MSWTLVDHFLSPYSKMDDIEAWERRIEAMLRQRPGDQGLLFALEDVRLIKGRAKELAAAATPSAQRP
ncbi:MAG: hypothetical protein Fur0034_20180 [Desulfuromonadia bacterium]